MIYEREEKKNANTWNISFVRINFDFCIICIGLELNENEKQKFPWTSHE